MVIAAELKEIRWQGDSRKVAHRFPKGARNALGKELTRVQEIRIPYDKEAYRVIYVAKLADCIYVLHAFHKKAKKGIATPKEEIDLASKRYKELVRSLRRS
jgi:phage-related protein